MQPNDTQSMIKIENVSKFFGDFQALNKVSIEVKKGERVVVCGPSGSGKSTMIRCINQLESHESGSIMVNGIALDGSQTALNSIRANVGMVFQQFNLFPHLSVLDNLTLGPMRTRNLSASDAHKRAMHYLELFRFQSRLKNIHASCQGDNNNALP